MKSITTFLWKELFPLPIEGLFPWELLDALPMLFENLPLGVHKSALPSQAQVVNPEKIFIGQGVVIEPFSTLIGPLYIGDGCHIQSGAYLRPYTFLEGGSRIGAGSEIKGSILRQGALAPHKNTILDSIVGVNVNFGALSTTANLRFDQGLIKIQDECGLWHQSHRKKVGAFVGDGALIGCHAVLGPGSVIYPHSRVYPLTFVTGRYQGKEES